MSEIPDDDGLPEIRVEAYDKIDHWRDRLDQTAKLKKRDVFERAAADLFLEAEYERDLGAVQAISDAVYFLGRDYAGLCDDDIQYVMVGAKAKAEQLNGRASSMAGEPTVSRDTVEPPPAESPNDYRNGKAADVDDHKATFEDAPPLTIEQWLARDLPEPDFIMGNWLSTTTRGLLVGPTGLGKTNLALALALHIAAGRDFLHWRGRRPCIVLYVDGEMSRRLFRQRIEDAVNRLGERPTGFHALSHEDVEKFAPLNSAAGQAYIERFITQIKPDFIVFDAIMCLLAGEMKEGQSWAAVMPWIRSLTRRRIGQLWLHHTGHDESRSYGDKTREWQLDTVVHMKKIEREDTDLSFGLEFRKARERTPETRLDFEEVTIALINDEWISSGKMMRRGTLNPSNKKFLDALTNVYASGQTEIFDGRKVVHVEHWKAECAKLGLIEKDKTPKARSWFSRNKRELIERNYIVSHFDQYVWKL
jgi:hypothetical protein